MAPRLIEAKYYGWCHDCGEEIEPGDLIGFNIDGQVICEDCREEQAIDELYAGDGNL